MKPTKRQIRIVEDFVKKTTKKVMNEGSASNIKLGSDQVFIVNKLLTYISNKFSDAQLSKIANGLDYDVLSKIRSKFKTAGLYGSTKQEKDVWK